MAAKAGKLFKSSSLPTDQYIIHREGQSMKAMDSNFLKSLVGRERESNPSLLFQ